jgi:hypothetical protein
VKENYLKSEPSRLKNYDGPMKQLKFLELMDKAASSISDGDLVDALIHGCVLFFCSSLIFSPVITSGQAGATLVADAAACGMFHRTACFLLIRHGRTLWRAQLDVLPPVSTTSMRLVMAPESS